MTDTIDHSTVAPYRISVPPHMVRALLEHLRNGTTDRCEDVVTLAPEIFTDRDIARRERLGVFGTAPFIAAHASELPKPHDFLTKRLPSNDAIIVRLGDGSVRCLVNMCRHRGAKVDTEPSGHCRVFSCMYHGWSYDLDGSLRNITYTDSFGDARSTTCTARASCRAEERHGFIWVVDNPDATIDVEGWLGHDLDGFLESYTHGPARLLQGRCRSRSRSTGRSCTTPSSTATTSSSPTRTPPEAWSTPTPTWSRTTAATPASSHPARASTAWLDHDPPTTSRWPTT